MFAPLRSRVARASLGASHFYIRTIIPNVARPVQPKPDLSFRSSDLSERRRKGVGGRAEWDGGPMGIRTPDLRNANATLYQLSYRPMLHVKLFGAPGGNRTPISSLGRICSIR